MSGSDITSNLNSTAGKLSSNTSKLNSSTSQLNFKSEVEEKPLEVVELRERIVRCEHRLHSGVRVRILLVKSTPLLVDFIPFTSQLNSIHL